MTQFSHSRTILRSSSIIGAASVTSILIGLIKFKVVALYLGPTGIGVYGLMLNIVSIAATIGGLGLATAATRQIASAAAADDKTMLAVACRAVTLAAWGLAAITLILMLILETPVARLVGQRSLSFSDMAWLALATAITVLTAGQTALLNGMRRIGDLARITIYGSMVGTICGLSAVAILDREGLLPLVLLAPLSTFVVGLYYVIRLPIPRGSATRLRVILPQWKLLAWMGFGLMASSLVTQGGQLFIRSYLNATLGARELGYFQASWMISMNYLTFVLAAMTTDFYPRLTGVISEPIRANQLVNEQAEMVVLLAGPIMIGMITYSPVIVHVLYSSDFLPAADIFRLQTLGDLLKIVSWPLGVLLLASGRTMTIFLLELLAMTVFGVSTVILVPSLGVEATGIAFIAMYVAYLPFTYWQARRVTGFKFKRALVVRIAILMILVMIVAAIVQTDAAIGMIAGTTTGLAVSVEALRRLAKLTGAPLSLHGLRAGIIAGAQRQKAHTKRPKAGR